MIELLIRSNVSADKLQSLDERTEIADEHDVPGPSCTE
jgi:hypothetical protein